MPKYPSFKVAIHRVTALSHFKEELAKPRAPMWWRGKRVFDNWSAFTRDVDQNAFYYAYCRQIEALEEGPNIPVEELSAYGDMVDDILCFCWRVVIEGAAAAMHESMLRRVFEASRASTASSAPPTPPPRWAPPAPRMSAPPKMSRTTAPRFCLRRRRDV